ncbi:MAG: hypothetical protein K2X81_08410, partial [Candidatus Obscuribacterales bacterium]|nr:hypothetical protein [Candidatus Obscuribacterales bacterium]
IAKSPAIQIKAKLRIERDHSIDLNIIESLPGLDHHFKETRLSELNDTLALLYTIVSDLSGSFLLEFPDKGLVSIEIGCNFSADGFMVPRHKINNDIGHQRWTGADQKLSLVEESYNFAWFSCFHPKPFNSNSPHIRLEPSSIRRGEHNVDYGHCYPDAFHFFAELGKDLGTKTVLLKEANRFIGLRQYSKAFGLFFGILKRERNPRTPSRMNLIQISETCPNTIAKLLRLCLQLMKQHIANASNKEFSVLKKKAPESNNKYEFLEPDQISSSFLQRWTKAPTTTEKDLTESALLRIYSRLGLKSPEFVWCDSYLQMLVYPIAVKLIMEGNTPKPDGYVYHAERTRWLYEELIQIELRFNSENSFGRPIQSNIRKCFWDLLQVVAEKSDEIVEPSVLDSIYRKLRGHHSCSPTVLRRRTDVILARNWSWLACRALTNMFGASYHDFMNNQIETSWNAETWHSVEGQQNRVFQNLNNYQEWSEYCENFEGWVHSPYFSLWFEFAEEWWGPWETCMLAPYLFLLENKPSQHLLTLKQSLIDWNTVHQGGNAYLFYENIVFACSRPIGFYVSPTGDFQNESDPVTLPMIESEQNIERRRVLMERYGYENYLKESGCEILQTDKFGTLLKKEVPNDEPIIMVQVQDATVNEDGSTRQYMLRVPPEMT